MIKGIGWISLIVGFIILTTYGAYVFLTDL